MRTHIHITRLYLVCGLSPGISGRSSRTRRTVLREKHQAEKGLRGCASQAHAGRGVADAGVGTAGKRARADALDVRAAGARACSFARSGQGRGAHEHLATSFVRNHTLRCTAHT